MAPSWKGTIAFGLVSIPARLQVVNEDHALHFNQLHGGCGARIRLDRRCDAGHAVEYSEIVKGYPMGDDTYVEISDADVEDLPVATKHLIEVTSFVDLGEIDPVFYTGKSYYLMPEKAGARGYELLHAAMLSRKRVGIGKIAFREAREHLVLIRARKDLLVVETLFWPDEVRTPAELDLSGAKPKKPELDMAKQLVDSLSGEFEPAAYSDSYREALLERIEQKAAGLEPVPGRPARKAEPAASLSEALERSLEAVRKGA